MYCVTVKCEANYNSLQFYFETLDEAKALLELSLKEGYQVFIKLAHEEEMLPV